MAISDIPLISSRRTPIPVFRIVLILFASLVFLSQCARFKVNKLQKNLLFSADIGKNGINFPVQGGVAHEIPGRVANLDDWTVISEPSNKTILIFKKNTIETVIYSSSLDKNLIRTGIKANLIKSDAVHVPGYSVAGTDDDFYIIDYSPIGTGEESGGLYKILHFDFKGNLLHVFGRAANPQLHFEQILWMDSDEDNRLWVLYRNAGKLILEGYEESKPKFIFDDTACEKVIFDGKKDENYQRKCEYIYPFYNGERVLFVGRVDKFTDEKTRSLDSLRFNYRIFKYKSVDDEEWETIFSKLNDIEDIPYIPYDKNHVIIWQTQQNNRFKYALYNLDGDLINNLQITLDGPRNSWRNTWANLSGKYYSLRVSDQKLELYQWK